MPDGSVPILIALVVLVFLSGFFSSTETAYSCANRIKLRSLASNGNKRAKQVLDLAETNYDKLISTILIGNNIVNIVATTLATILFGLIFKNDPSTANIVSTVVMTVSILIFGEITPKLIAKSFPEKMAMTFYPIIKFVYYLLYILNLVFSGWKWLISKIFRFKDDDIVTEAEIMTMVEEAEEDGTLKEEETELIRSVIEFDDLEVGDILVPRVNIVAVDISSSMDDIRKVFAKEGYSRIPVYKDSIDTIIGTIHEKDFFNAYLNGKKGIDGIMQNAFYTTEHAKISDLLKQLQIKKVHIAVVLDEYGGTLGLITMEDILEELVGEIYDEHDEIINFFKDVKEDICIVDGNAPIADFFEKFNLEEDESLSANTLSGFIIELLGIIPHAGYQFDYKNLSIEIMKSTVKRILQVKVTVNAETEEQTNE
ncbi:MAG: HlyC/CorC family transporter [Clostridiales bacterium]|nr:HlyC/CorC family transporter [Clostridiales bacterium]